MGPPLEAQAAAGPTLEIEGATLDDTGHVVVSLRIADGGVPVPDAEAALALAPAFTLAVLAPHPVDGILAWRSLVFPAGSPTVAELPPAGPGTPSANVLLDVPQPGADRGGTLVGSAGSFTYRFADPPVEADRLEASLAGTDTLRVGAWLVGAGTVGASSTFDFRPDGGEPAQGDTVLDERCGSCHEAVTAHDGTVGVRLCTTCHTWQAADPETVDPAAMSGETAATFPNPLELGRLVHRIHRGNELPTLYKASSTDPAPALPSAALLPPPYFPGKNPPVAGRRFSVVGALGQEAVYGRAGPRHANGLSTDVAVNPGFLFPSAEGVVFSRDLRGCDLCHDGAPRAAEVHTAVSRRTCHGCHPEAWFGDAPITDAVHFAHPGGPRADDGACGGCHVAATEAQPKVYAPIAEIHVPPHESPRFNRPVVEIVSVEDLKAGQAPIVRFRLWDTCGGTEPQTISPIGAPAPATCPPGGSPVPRALSGGSRWFVITVAGPTAPAFGLSRLLSDAPGNPDPFALVAGEDGVFTYAFTSKVPEGASGTWAVGVEARRAGTAPTTAGPGSTKLTWSRYVPYVEGDAGTDRFEWPYTAETLYETPQNPVVYVDTATGSLGKGNDGSPLPRRRVVSQAKCARCHEPIEVHGSVRLQVEYCVLCHSPERTDWASRPGVAPWVYGLFPAHPGVAVTGTVNLAATLDGIEERSLDFKVLVHRIHAGGRAGVASLEGVLPNVLYGGWGTVWFFDGRRFPNLLQDCTLCHEGKTYGVDAVPADAPPTRANETATILHAPGSAEHSRGEDGRPACTATPPIQAACRGCHTTGATAAHVLRNTQDGVERCAGCHVQGPVSVDVAHGLAPAGAPGLAATWSAIAERVLGPRCASAACHGGSPPAAFPRLEADAWGEVVDVASQQATSLPLVKPFAPAESYLLLKLRGEGGGVGGLSTPMPPDDAPPSPSELAAIEAWIANGAPND